MKNKETKARFLVICSALLFLAVLLADFYLAINFSDSYIAVIVFGLADIVCLFGTIYGILVLREEKEIRREEQYDSIFKSEKASYLLLKKYFEEIEEKLDRLEHTNPATASFSTEEVINAQKAAAKVIISRSKENADAILGATDILAEAIDNVANVVDSANAKLVEEQKRVTEGQIKELMMSLKDMELRINSAIMQCQGAIAQSSTPVNVVAPVSAPVAMPVVPAPVVESAPSVTSQVEEPLIEEEPGELINEVLSEEPEAEELFVEEPEAEEELLVEEPEAEEELLVEEPEAEEELLVEEPEAEEELLVEEPTVEEELLVEEPIIEEEPVVEETPVVEEIPPMPDLSDPNAKMNPDDIAALIANMNTDSAPMEEPEPEPESEPVVEEAPAEEIPPMPDLSDPNAKMSPDDIAALIANMASDPTPMVEPEPEVAPEPEPEPEPVVEEAVEEEKPPMPDLSDPNKVMSPEEIAALIANI